jgi:hypothetical protein
MKSQSIHVNFIEGCKQSKRILGVLQPGGHPFPQPRHWNLADFPYVTVDQETIKLPWKAPPNK